ncbi:MAG: hypothetical protein ISS77_02095 [Phycisphaerae bacterium]|nr:hypothetical protein [Phycisphaerae bacterium]
MNDFKDKSPDDFDDIINFDEEENVPLESLPFDDSDLEEEKPKPDISHKPLSLGNSTNPQESPKPPVATFKKVAGASSSGEKITRVKTFFTKLHVGSIGYVDEQINDWLNDNPDVTIKKTNVTVGNLISKTTEPNIIINVWY